MTPAEFRASARTMKVGKRNKYGAKAVVIDGVRFASGLEARRWAELQILERAGEITHLTRQPKFPLRVDGEVIGSYIGDASYRVAGKLIVEDSKSDATITPLFRWKAKHLKAQYKIEVQVVK